MIFLTLQNLQELQRDRTVANHLHQVVAEMRRTSLSAAKPVRDHRSLLRGVVICNLTCSYVNQTYRSISFADISVELSLIKI